MTRRRLQPFFCIALASLALTVVGCGSDCDSDSRAAPPLTVMTYNVLCSFCDNRNFDPWAERLPYFGDIFARHDPDLIGLQELTPLNREVDAILEQAPGYGAIFFTQESGTTYPDALILYRSTRFEVIETGNYWLSPTPDTPLTIGFAPIQFPRLVIWARLRDLAADGREIFFATTHFDNNSPSQERSAPLVQERTIPFKGYPILFVGDFNARPGSNAYRILTEDPSRDVVFQNAFDLTDWRLVTNQNPAPAFDLASRIDHIFLSGDDVTWSVSDWTVDLTVYGPNDRYPSDHFPVVATLQYQ